MAETAKSDGSQPAASARILYLGVQKEGFVQKMKFAGIRRYAETRRWEVVAVPKPQSVPARIPALLEKYRPIGCVAEFFGGDRSFLVPDLFGSLPVAYLDMPEDLRHGFAGRAVSVDEEAVARTALRELSAVRPASLAVVEFRKPLAWSAKRAAAFRSLAAAEGRTCNIFAAYAGETVPARAARLTQWLSALPRPCGVFAVNDEIARHVCAACRTACLHIPKDVSLIGVDNNPKRCETDGPALSSIQIDFERMGYLAARMLAERSENRAAVGPLMVARRKSTSGRGRHEHRMLEAMEMIRREACDGLTAAALAARFDCSRRLFNMRFREATGHSVLDEILHVRLERAFTLLSQTDMSIGAVADFCGFRSYWALDFLFRTRFGMSMGKWRKLNGRIGR